MNNLYFFIFYIFFDPNALWASSLSSHNSLEFHREKAKNILMTYCGECHLPKNTLNTPPLQIFNLEEKYWYVRLSNKQLKSALERLESFAKVKGDRLRILEGIKPPAPPVHVAPGDITAFQDFMKREISNRSH
jgi:hypothetical protein